LKSGVIDFNEIQVTEAACSVVEENIDAAKAVFKGLLPGLEEVGRLYDQQKFFVPELLLSADAMYAGLDILRPHIKDRSLVTRGLVIMGVVQGDIHDIGITILKMMFDVSGFDVHNLGRDVPLEVFVKEQLRINADLLCLSAMMTTTMVRMKDIISEIKNTTPKVKVMVGGAPVTREIAESYGADGYAPNASSAIKEAFTLLRA